jgi:hypothetical protein
MDMIRKMLVFTSSNRSSDHPQIHGNDVFHSLISPERLMRIRGTPIPALGNYFGYWEPEVSFNRLLVQPQFLFQTTSYKTSVPIPILEDVAHSCSVRSSEPQKYCITALLVNPDCRGRVQLSLTMLTTCKLPSFSISFLRSRWLEMRKLAF